MTDIENSFGYCRGNAIKAYLFIEGGDNMEPFKIPENLKSFEGRKDTIWVITDVSIYYTDIGYLHKRMVEVKEES